MPLIDIVPTVQSVGISVPAYMSVSGSPVTSAGTIALSFNSQSANKIFGSPDLASGTPSFRSLTINDLPSPYSNTNTPLTNNTLLFVNGSGFIGSHPAPLSGTNNIVVQDSSGSPYFNTIDNLLTAGTGISFSGTNNVTISVTGAPPTGAAGGDLSGTYPNPTVASINGNPLGSTNPQASNILIGNNTAWVSQPVHGDVSLTTAGLTTVSAIWGNSIASTTPTTNQFLQYSGSLWSPSTLTLAGDVTGGYGANIVAKINGVTLGSTTATAGNILIGSGSQWATNAVSGDITLSSTGATKVIAIQNVSVTSTGPIGGQLLEYDASGGYGLHFRNLKIVSAATTANLAATYANGTSGVGATLTNSGTQVALSIDGYSLSAGQFVLVKNQSTAAQNGIYVVTTVGNGSTNWVLTRSYDFNQSSNMVCSLLIGAQQGTSNAGTYWSMTQNAAITVGTTGITWQQMPCGLATSSNLGGIELNTDLGGTATAPNVVGLQGVSLPAPSGSSTYLQYNSGSLSWATGTLPAGISSPGTGQLSFAPTSTSATVLGGTMPASFAGNIFNFLDSSSAENLKALQTTNATELHIFSPTSGTSRAAIFAGMNGYQTSSNGMSVFLNCVNISGSITATGDMSFVAAENQSSGHLGTDWHVATTATGAGSRSVRLVVSANGNVVTNGTGTTPATNTADGLFFMPIVNGVPTGTGTKYTGTMGSLVDATDNVTYLNTTGSTWVDVVRRKVTAAGTTAYTMLTSDGIITFAFLFGRTITLCDNAAYKGGSVKIFSAAAAANATIAAAGTDSINNNGTTGSITVGPSTATYAHYVELTSTGDGVWRVSGGG